MADLFKNPKKKKIQSKSVKRDGCHGFIKILNRSEKRQKENNNGTS